MPKTPLHLDEPVERGEGRQDTDRGKGECQCQQDTDHVLGGVDGRDKPGRESRHLGGGRSIGGREERHIPRSPSEPRHTKRSVFSLDRWQDYQSSVRFRGLSFRRCMTVGVSSRRERVRLHEVDQLLVGRAVALQLVWKKGEGKKDSRWVSPVCVPRKGSILQIKRESEQHHEQASRWNDQATKQQTKLGRTRDKESSSTFLSSVCVRCRSQRWVQKRTRDVGRPWPRLPGLGEDQHDQLRGRRRAGLAVPKDAKPGWPSRRLTAEAKRHTLPSFVRVGAGDSDGGRGLVHVTALVGRDGACRRRQSRAEKSTAKSTARWRC